MIFHGIRFGQIFLTIKRSLAQCDVHRSDLSPILATEPFLLTNIIFFPTRWTIVNFKMYFKQFRLIVCKEKSCCLMNLQQKWFQWSENYSCRAKISQIKVQTTEKQGLSWTCPGKQSFFISKYIKLGHFQGDARRCQHFGHFYVILYSNRWNTVLWPNVDCPMLSFSDFLNLVTLQYQCESQ